MRTEPPYNRRHPVEPCCVCGGPVYGKGENGYYNLHGDCDEPGAQTRLAGTAENQDQGTGG